MKGNSSSVCLPAQDTSWVGTHTSFVWIAWAMIMYDHAWATLEGAPCGSGPASQIVGVADGAVRGARAALGLSCLSLAGSSASIRDMEARPAASSTPML